ncbi:MAG: sigma-54-dependent Fis family transcriptional regulator [Flammeovirgaceae bacterium]|nr:sigma-54-dependent Fis family transcriptional regulator [Flammeovirgaceae bacterium]|tara:strand:+ start:3382 stop:4608 length:1227 start_codon:yes stop_codon:yes gene_type:complete
MLEKIKSVKQKFGIVGNSDSLNHAIQVAIQVAPTDMTVLINGESGTGKESFSKIIHSMSKRKHGQFIAVNCGAIPEGTIDSELFGHEKGSFTGANESRKGYFEVTDGGTIFLDEIGEMPLSTQSRLLRILENGEFIKVGSSKVQKTNVRIIAATNVKLKEAVDKRKFREDLYYRLNTVPIIVPPLRERGEDISLLFRKFSSDFSDKNKIEPIRLDEESKNLLIKYRFPGNIRELKNLTEQISILEIDRNITKDVIDKYLPKNSNLPVLSNNIEKKESDETYNERDILYKILFDLKSDMNEMKKVIDSIISNTNSISSESKNFLEDTQPKKNKNLIIDKPSNIKENQFQDVTELVNENESLSIELKEKELIIKALLKNKNKRKYAAKDLGISERTLYRKIKNYNLDKSH